MDDLRGVVEAAYTAEESSSNVEVNTNQGEVESAVPATESVVPVEQGKSEGTGGDATTAPGGSSPEADQGEKAPTIEEVAGGKPEGQAPGTDTAARIDRPPQSWKGDAKKVWAELPLRARQEVVKRERDMAAAMQETAGARQTLQQVNQVLSPHMDRIRHAYNGDALQAIDKLLTVERVLFNGTPSEKAQLIANMVKNFGIDVGALDSFLVGQPAPEHVQQQSNLEALLEQKLAPVMNMFQMQRQVQQEAVRQVQEQAAHTVESMAVDPRFPHFNEVRNEMADLIDFNRAKGVPLSLEEAYNKAIRMDDNLVARNQAQSATQSALAAHQQAQRARGASSSVSGAPSGTSNFGNPADLRGSIEAAFGNASGRM